MSEGRFDDPGEAALDRWSRIADEVLADTPPAEAESPEAVPQEGAVEDPADAGEDVDAGG